MAVTLVEWAGMQQAMLRERYAAYQGHRIPCVSGRAAYHLKPEQAERCCSGVLARLILELRGMLAGVP